MAEIKRSDVIQKAVNDLALSPAVDKIPSETLDKVQLTYNLNKQFSSFVASNILATTGTLTVTLPTIDVRSEIFLTSIDFDIIKDATCDLATGTLQVQCTPFEQGIAKTILSVSTITLTAQAQHAHVDFNYPLKLKPNVNITLLGTFTVGVLNRSICCSGFIVSSN